MLGATIVQAPAWIGGTAVGVFSGGELGDPERLGLDVVFPALFLALLVGNCAAGGGCPRSRRSRRRSRPRAYR